MTSPISTFAGNMVEIIKWSATGGSIAGGAGSAPQNASQLQTDADVWVTGNTNNGTANQLVILNQSIGANSTANVNLASALTNVLGSPTATFARLKKVILRLLSVAQDATNGTNCSGVKVGGAAANTFVSVAGSGGLSNNTSAIDIPNGEQAKLGMNQGAGTPVNNTNQNLLITNLDVSNAGTLQMILVGADS